MGTLENLKSSSDYGVEFISELKGRGLFAKKAYKKGDLIFEESPLVCAQFSWNTTYGYLACEYCMRPLETAAENAKRLSGGSVPELQFPECSPTDKSCQVKCETCQKAYCSDSCRKRAWDQYHKTLCHTSDTSPFSLLEEAWKAMHYPPESCTIMLLARIFAMVEQQSEQNKEQLFNQISNFCSRSSEDCASLEDKLGSEFGQRLEHLRELLAVCFPNATIARAWLTPTGFQWLFTMVAVNGQGVGTSVFSQWVENVSKQFDGNEEIDAQIDSIYEKLMNHSGCEFLNNEGSALYRLQSSCNHSCSPNAEIKFPYSNFVLNLMALQDISVGDEICISYMEEDLLERGRGTRNNYLRSNYYFTCTCEKCQSQVGDPESASEDDGSMSVDSNEED
uniref:SET and MYND domain-containing protein 5 n=1 Tax=Cacopsylla melanoneura TaxID=428564 RepID=A0A8D8WG37_9HEMI